MDSRTAKTFKVISCILNNIMLFVAMFMFSFNRLFSSIEAIDTRGDAGFIHMMVGILAMLVLVIPTIFSFFADVIAMIIVLINDKLDTKGLRSKIKAQVIIETIQFGLIIIMAMLSGIIPFLIITVVEISIILINVYIWNSIK